MAESLQRATLVTVLESEDNTAGVPAVVSTMQAVYTLIEEIHLLVGREEKLNVYAKPFQPGSLEIPIELAAIAAALWQGQGLVDWILIIAKQYLNLKKLLGGQKYQITGDNNIVFAEGNTINVYHQTAELLRPHNAANRQFQEAFRRVSADPKIDGFRLNHTETGDRLIELRREQFHAFNIPKGIIEEGPSREFVRERIRLRIRSAAFDEKLHWRFAYDGKLISAAISDEAFLKRVMSGEKFASGDTLVADVLVRQRWDVLSNGFIDDEYEVVHVHDHIPHDDRGGQLSLLDEENQEG